MIRWEDVYKVVVAMAPLYVALMLGYGSMKWWRIFTPEQGEAVNRLVSYFTLPLFTLEFTAHVDPFKMNYLFIGADAISKVIIVTVLALWAKCSSKGSYCWSITSFSLSTLTNSLVVGVPLLKAMYGPMAVDLVVQSSVIQAIVWLTTLLFVLEIRRSGNDFHSNNNNNNTASLENATPKTEHEVSNSSKQSFCSLMKTVGLKLAMNPNSYACLLGIIWAFFANSIMEGSILIMSRAGTGTAMFSMGLFMAMQEKIIACGASLTVIGMALKFIAGPLAMAIGSLIVGLHGDVLRVAIIQAALPQSITSFIYAKEYGLHADVLSTAVIFGMIVSLPVLIGYYAVLEFVH
ncbi:auxin efflux carrier component 5-like isoform X2 [Olea europaea var. sylvestris]|uniref:Auxin efflux carrier component n=1 Tax=Olea europaea subsp. europaea TaxID=158383 RepID=A0A8S0VLJ5_OLEEU|nr:auxin efflux carrier component 5-like isoform X2 [Olea europaea var. sylvestris]XP_022845737.1 auxin efflux carrier component 5-like isoform X2 [Olea europaea var. sylvestris]CAA3030764.1 auxin efflux carrier component 5 [Olea europaea subsp. europaea]